MSNKSIDLQDIVALISMVATAIAILASIATMMTPTGKLWAIALGSGIIAILGTASVVIMEFIYSMKSRRSLHVIRHG